MICILQYRFILGLALVLQQSAHGLAEDPVCDQPQLRQIHQIIEGQSVSRHDVRAISENLETSIGPKFTTPTGAIGNGDIWTPLTASIKCNRFGLAAYLLGKGADANAATDRGYSPLWLLCNSSEGRSQSAVTLGAILLEHGAQVGVTPREQVDPPFDVNPLHVASQNGNVELVNLLLKSGADPNAKDSAGSTPRDYAVSALNTRSRYARSKGLDFETSDIHDAFLATIKLLSLEEPDGSKKKMGRGGD